MEVFLLLADEIDDAVAILRSLWPRLFGLVVAISLLFVTGFAVRSFPRATLPVVAVLLSATLFERLRRRHLEASSPANR